MKYKYKYKGKEGIEALRLKRIDEKLNTVSKACVIDAEYKGSLIVENLYPKGRVL